MPRRRRPQHLYNIEPAPQPPPAANWLTTLGNSIPLPWVLAAAAAFLIWYGATNTERSQGSKEVDGLKSGLSELSKTIAATSKEQDERRAALSREFLSSNKEIASKVGELATTIAVQQAQAKTTSDALAKISDQLQQLNSRGPAVRR